MRTTRANETASSDRPAKSYPLDLGCGSDRDWSRPVGPGSSPLKGYWRHDLESTSLGSSGDLNEPGDKTASNCSLPREADHQDARLLESRFPLMSTQVGLWLDSSHPKAELALRRARLLLHLMEKRLTRFSADSELSRLNARAGKGPIAVSPWLYGVVEAALRLAALTSGLFDPTVLPQLVRAGYGPGPPRGSVGYGGVRLDAKSRSVELEEGVALDLGGVAKGWAADRLANVLSGYGSALIDLGGDIACRGPRAWLVGVEDPHHPQLDLCQLELREEGVATSSTLKRRWSGGHHLIDPRSGQPSSGDLVAATVVAPTATLAEGAAKAALLMGESRGKELLLEAGLRGILVKSDGTVSEVSM